MRLVCRDQQSCSCGRVTNAVFLIGDEFDPEELCTMCAAELDVDAVSEAISARMEELADALECIGDHDLFRELARRRRA